MDFEFANFKLYMSILQKINLKRQQKMLSPLWMDYESIHNLHSYQESYLEFVKHEPQNQPLLIKTPIKNEIQSTQQLMDPHYNHICLALLSHNFIILLSKKSFAIDRISLEGNIFELTIVRLTKQIHLWGIQVILQDSSEKLIGPDSVNINAKETEYTLTIPNKCIAASLIQTSVVQKYGCKTFYVNIPSHCTKSFLFPIVPIQSLLDKILRKSNARARVSSYRNMGMHQMSSMLKNVSISDSRFGLPEINLNPRVSGSLFGQTKLKQVQKSNNESIRKRSSIFGSENNIFFSNNISQSLNKNLKQELQSSQTSLLNGKSQMGNCFVIKQMPEIVPSRLPQKIIYRQKTTIVIKNNIIKRTESQPLNIKNPKKLVQFCIDYCSSTDFTKQYEPQLQNKQWQDDSDNFLYSAISVTNFIKYSNHPVIQTQHNKYQCAPFQNNLNKDPIQQISKYMKSRDYISFLNLSTRQSLEVYKEAQKLQLKSGIQEQILMLCLMSKINRQIWEFISNLLKSQSIPPEAEDIFYSYFLQVLDADQKTDYLNSFLQMEMHNQFEIIMIKNLYERMLMHLKNDYQMKQFLVQMLEERSFGISDQLKQYKSSNNNLCIRNYHEDYDLNHSYFIQKYITKQKYQGSVSTSQTQNNFNRFYKQPIFEFEHLDLKSNKDNYLLITQAFSFANRLWRVYIQNSNQGGHLFFQQCGIVEKSKFQTRFSSIILKYVLEINGYKTEKQLSFSFANGQKLSIGTQITGLPKDSSLNINLKVWMKFQYIHSLCLNQLAMSSYLLFPVQKKVPLNFRNIAAMKEKYQNIERAYFPNQNKLQDVVKSWFIEIPQFQMFSLLNSNYFQSHDQQSILEMLIKYYQARDQKGLSDMNIWLPLYGIRYRYINISQLLSYKSSILRKSIFYISTLNEQVRMFLQKGNRPLQRGRFHSSVVSQDFLDASDLSEWKKGFCKGNQVSRLV